MQTKLIFYKAEFLIINAINKKKKGDIKLKS